jgi:protease-4
VQSDEIWQEIQYLKKQYPQKKLYAVIGDTGASGAYYIASAADEIIVNPSSLVGSIGVIMPNYGVSNLMQKLGVEDRTMTSGENKALLSMTQPVDAAQKAHVQGVLDNVHAHFINAVKQGRGAKLKSTDPAIFSGLFWTGEQAVQLGIADRTGSLQTLKRELKTDKALNYTVEYSPFESILGRMGASLGEGVASSVAQKLSTESQTKLQ